MSWFDEPRGDAPDRAQRRGRRRRDPRHAQVPQARATLFLVVDEVSQYVLQNKDRVLELRPSPRRSGQQLKGKAWLLALGQQKLDEEADRLVPRLGTRTASPRSSACTSPRRTSATSSTGGLLQKQPGRGGQLRATVREAPGRPEALRLRLRSAHGGRVRRGLPDAPGARRPAAPDHDRACARGRPGRRATTRRSAGCSSSSASSSATGSSPTWRSARS